MKKLIIFMMIIFMMFLFCEKVEIKDQPCDTELIKLLLKINDLKMLEDSICTEKWRLSKKVEEITRAQKKLKLSQN